MRIYYRSLPKFTAGKQQAEGQELLKAGPKQQAQVAVDGEEQKSLAIVREGKLSMIKTSV